MPELGIFYTRRSKHCTLRAVSLPSVSDSNDCKNYNPSRPRSRIIKSKNVLCTHNESTRQRNAEESNILPDHETKVTANCFGFIFFGWKVQFTILHLLYLVVCLLVFFFLFCTCSCPDLIKTAGLTTPVFFYFCFFHLNAQTVSTTGAFVRIRPTIAREYYYEYYVS